MTEMMKVFNFCKLRDQTTELKILINVSDIYNLGDRNEIK